MTAELRNLLAGLVLGAVCAGAAAQVDAPFQTSLSADIDLSLDEILNDESVVLGDGSTVLSEDRPGVDLVGLHRDAATGEDLRIFDVAATIDGSVMREGAVVSFGGGTATELLSPRDLGSGPGVEFDAVTRLDESSLLFSYDISSNASGVSVDDEDLVLLSGNTTSIFFDGSAEGIDPALDLDAAHYAVDGEFFFLFLSFDGHGHVAGNDFSDEDVVVFKTVLGTWSPWLDLSDQLPEWTAADVDALVVDLGNPDAIFSDGFESGDVSAWQ